MAEKTSIRKYQLAYARQREQVLTGASYYLRRCRRVMWYLETLTFSVRYLQWIESKIGGENMRYKRFSYREKLWFRAVMPALCSAGKQIEGFELGVASGRATQWWHSNLLNLKSWKGFDTFEGLPTAWSRGGVSVMEKGVFAPSNPSIPYPVIDQACEINWHRGLIEETLPSIMRKTDCVLIVLIDVDLYEPTRAVLDWLLLNGLPGDCIYFDEAFDAFNEGKALREIIEEGLRFEILGFTGSGLAIRLTERAG